MEGRTKSGSSLIGVGAFLVFLGALFFLLVYFGFLTDESWLVPAITTLRASAAGVVLGFILLAAGLYTRSALGKSEQKVAELEEARRAEAEKLKVKNMELGRAKAEAERKKVALQLTRGQLNRAKAKARKKERALHRVSGKLGERSKRLKKIRKLAEV